MNHYLRLTFLSLAFLWAAGLSLRAQNSVPNPSFEDGTQGWGLFIPDESKDKNCRFSVTNDSPHSGKACAQMQADGFARFAIGLSALAVKPGERYRIGVWVRADAQAQAKPGTPGLLIRLTMSQNKVDSPSGHFYIGLNNQVTRQDPPVPAVGSTLPTVWAKIEAVVEIPPDADEMSPGLFTWYAKGTIFADDFSVEKVDASTPVNPIVASVSSSPAPNDTFAPGPVVTDAEALAALNLDAPGMEKVKALAPGGDMAAIRKAYLDYRRTASPAKWTIMPSDEPATATEQTDPVGNEICAHYIRNGYGFDPKAANMGKDFNWTFNPVPKSDPGYTDEWTFCAISRTQFWNKLVDAYWKTHNEKYAAEWVNQMEDFVVKNPLNHDAINGAPFLWRTLDASERMDDSWPHAYYHVLNSPAFTPEAQWTYLRSILDHVTLLSGGLKNPDRTGNWVASECFGLYTIGVLFPELKDSSAWRQLAMDRLTSELNRMVPPDGFEAELTPGYHYFSLSSFVGPLKLAKLNNLPVPDIFLSKIIAMYRAPVWVMDQAGNDVPTNDSGIVNAAGYARTGAKLVNDPTLEWAASAGKSGVQPPDSTMLPYAGFYAMRGGWKLNGLFLFFRGGPTGLGHEHEDMLEIVLRAWNQTLLFDPGTYLYDHSDWRRFTRGTASHNTIIVDGKWQHRGPSKVPVVDSVSNPWVTTPVFDYVAATYDGGYQLSVYDQKRAYSPEDWVGPIDHSVTHTRRVLFLKPYYALVLDTLDGTGNHTFDAHFHMDAPSAHLDAATQAAFSDNKDGVQVALYPLDHDKLKAEVVQGQKDPLLGWMPNQHRPIPTIRFRKQQSAPAIFATFLYPYRDKAPAFDAKPLAVTGDGVWGQSFSTPNEKTEVAIVKDGTAKAFSLMLPPEETVKAEAAGLVLRKSVDGEIAFTGGWSLRSYSDDRKQFTLDAPGNILVGEGGKSGKLLFFNAGDKAVAATLTKPFARTATLAPGAWTEVSKDGDQPASSPPSLFPP